MKLKTKIVAAVVLASSIGAGIVYANGGTARIQWSSSTATPMTLMAPTAHRHTAEVWIVTAATTDQCLTTATNTGNTTRATLVHLESLY